MSSFAKVSLFANVTVEAGATETLIDTVTFTPPADGQAVVRSRGYCFITQLTAGANRIEFAGGRSTLTPFLDSNAGNYGIIGTVEGPARLNFVLDFSTESLGFPVKTGVPISFVLVARHSVSTDETDLCSGTISVEVYPRSPYNT